MLGLVPRRAEPCQYRCDERRVLLERILVFRNRSYMHYVERTRGAGRLEVPDGYEGSSNTYYADISVAGQLGNRIGRIVQRRRLCSVLPLDKF